MPVFSWTEGDSLPEMQRESVRFRKAHGFEALAAGLTERFGQQYRDYMATTRRFVRELAPR